MQTKFKNRFFLISGYFLVILMFCISLYAVYALVTDVKFSLNGTISYTKPAPPVVNLSATLLDTTDLSTMDSGDLPCSLEGSKNITEMYDFQVGDTLHIENFRLQGVTEDKDIRFDSVLKFTHSGIDENLLATPLFAINKNYQVDADAVEDCMDYLETVMMGAAGYGDMPAGEECIYLNDDFMAIMSGGDPTVYMAYENSFIISASGDENNICEFYIAFLVLPETSPQSSWNFECSYDISESVFATVYQVDKTGSVFEACGDEVILDNSADYTATATPNDGIIFYNFEIINLDPNSATLSIEVVSSNAELGSEIYVLVGNLTTADFAEMVDDNPVDLENMIVATGDIENSITVPLDDVQDGQYNFLIVLNSASNSAVETVFNFTVGIQSLDYLDFQLMNNSYYAVRIKDNAPINATIPATYNDLPVKEVAENFYSGNAYSYGISITMPDSIEYFNNTVNYLGFRRIKLSDNIKYINGVGLVCDNEFVFPSKLNFLCKAYLYTEKMINSSYSESIDVTIPQNLVYLKGVYATYINSFIFERTSGWSSFDVTNKTITTITTSDISAALLSYSPNAVYTVFLNANDANGDYYYHLMNPQNNEIGIISKSSPSGAVSLTLPVTYSATNYTVTAIGPSCFKGATDMTSITIPEGIKYIHSYAFAGCTGLTSITLPSSLEYIGDHAFDGCSNLAEITFADYSGNKISLKCVADSAFDGCTGLNKVILQSNDSLNRYIKNVSYGDTDSNPLGFAKKLYVNSTEVTSITVPSETLWLNAYVFQGAQNITTFNLPQDLYIIGAYAFYGCEAMTSFTFPQKMTVVSDYMLYGCQGITSLTIPDTIKKVGSTAFAEMVNLTTINYNAPSASFSSSGAFSNAGTNGAGIVLNIGADVTSLPSNFMSASINHPKINEVRFLGNKIKSIGSDAFEYVTVKRVYVPEMDFWYNITFGDTGSNPLNGAKCLYVNNVLATSITVPSGVTQIKDYAFFGCLGITHIYMPTGVVTIGSQAFYNCSNLVSVVIPSGATTIDSLAFYNCEKLFEVNNLSTMTIEIGSKENGYVAYYARNIRLEGQTSKILESSNVIYYKNSNTDYIALGLTSQIVTSITIDANTTEIFSKAFYNCEALQTVSFASNSKLEVVGNSAFENCDLVTTVALPSSLCKLGSAAFYSCANLSSLTFGTNSNLAEIGSRVVDGCPSLTALTIPESVIYLPKSAFASSSLTSVTFENPYNWKTQENYLLLLTRDVSLSSSSLSDPTTAASYLKSTYNSYPWRKDIISYSLDSTNMTCSIYAVSSTKSTLGRSLYIPSTYTIDNKTYTVTSISGSGFSDCTNIVTVHIPSTVRFIGQSAFSGCTNLAAVYFANANNWFVADSESAVSGTNLTAANLQNTATAATYLLTNYVSKYWLSSVNVTFATDLDYSDIARETTTSSTVYGNNIASTSVPTKSGYKFAGYFVDTTISSLYSTTTSGSNVTYKFDKTKVDSSIWVIIKVQGSGLNALPGANSQYYSYSSDGTVGYFVVHITDLSLDDGENYYLFTFDKSLASSHSVSKVGQMWYDHSGNCTNSFLTKKDITLYAYWVYSNWQPT